MLDQRGKLSLTHIYSSTTFILVFILSITIIHGSIRSAAAADWRNVVQPTGSLYSGTLNKMESIGALGPLLVPADANSLLAQYKGCVYPPFDASVSASQQTSVTLIKTTKTLYLTRSYNTSDPDPNKRSNPAGSWVMRAATVRGLTAEQIKDVFALPAVPTGIAYARIPAGHVLWTGIAGPINSTVNSTYPDWGRGGGSQIYIDNRFATSGSAEVVYVSKDLSGRALLYSPIAGTGNAGSIASYLDSLIPGQATPQGTVDLTQYNARNLVGAYSQLDDVLGPLDWLSFGNQAVFTAALNQLGPERYDALTRVDVRNNLLFGKAFARRTLASDGTATAAAGRRNDADSASPGARDINFWATGLGEFGNFDGSGEHTGFDFSSGGFVLGVDVFRTDTLVLGVGGGYLRSDFNWDNQGGNTSIDSPKLGVYSNYTNPSGWFLDGLLTGGYDSMSVKRSIVFLDVANTAKSDPDGYDLLAQVRAGYEFPVAGWTITPKIELTYIYFQRSGFDETGAAPINLSVRGEDYQTFRTQLGIKVEKDIPDACGTIFTPSLEVAWAREMPLDSRRIESGIIGQSGFFVVGGVGYDTDGLVVNARLKARLSGNLNLYMGYGTEISEDLVSHQIGLGMSYRF